MIIRADAVDTCIRWAIARKDVYVQINQARRHVHSLYIHRAQRLPGGDVRPNRRNFAVTDADVAYSIDVVPRVDDVAALEDDIVCGLRLQAQD